MEKMLKSLADILTEHQESLTQLEHPVIYQ